LLWAAALELVLLVTFCVIAALTYVNDAMSRQLALVLGALYVAPGFGRLYLGDWRAAVVGAAMKVAALMVGLWLFAFGALALVFGCTESSCDGIGGIIVLLFLLAGGALMLAPAVITIVSAAALLRRAHRADGTPTRGHGANSPEAPSD
jgi:hypothetical protein